MHKRTVERRRQEKTRTKWQAPSTIATDNCKNRNLAALQKGLVTRIIIKVAQVPARHRWNKPFSWIQDSSLVRRFLKAKGCANSRRL